MFRPLASRLVLSAARMTAVLLCLTWNMIATAEALPAARIPDALGISIHGLNDPVDEARQLREAGFRIVRLDLVWERIERNPGRYDFGHMDALVDALRHESLRPMFVLIYSNVLYAPRVEVDLGKGRIETRTSAPRGVPARAAYARFAAAAVDRYAHLQPIWEIWNEPDRAGFWPPVVDAESYAMLALEACRAMRERDRTAVIVAPGAADAPTPKVRSPKFIETLVDRDRQGCLDGISVHPYVFVDQLERTPAVWDDMRALIAERRKLVGAPGSKVPEPVSSEWGLSTYREGLTNDTQAAYLVKVALLNLSRAVRLSVWYDWRDDGDDPHNPEHRYGLLTRSGQRKPALEAMKTMTRTLDGATFACSLTAAVPRPDATQLVFATSTKRTLVAWSRDHQKEWKADATALVHIDARLPVLGAIDMYGGPVPVRRVGERLIVGPAFQPVYLQLPSATSSDACRGLV